MLLTYDLDQNALIQSAGIISVVSSISVKNQTSQIWQVQFVRGGIAQDLPEGTTLAFGAKVSKEYDSDFVVYAGPEAWSGPDENHLYTVAPNFNTTQLNDALGTNVGGGSTAIEAASITLMGEIQFISGDNISASQTFNVVVANNVIKGDEGAPTDATPGYYNESESDARYLQKGNNLSDLANAGTARANLGLGTAAIRNLDTDVTLAADSDTVIATQKAVKAYVDAHSDGGGGPSPWLIKTDDDFIVAEDRIQADTSGGPFSLGTPATPAVGDSFQVEDAKLSWGTNALTITYNGTDKINGTTANYVANVNGGKLNAVYISSGYGWSIK